MKTTAAAAAAEYKCDKSMEETLNCLFLNDHWFSGALQSLDYRQSRNRNNDKITIKRFESKPTNSILNYYDTSKDKPADGKKLSLKQSAKRYADEKGLVVISDQISAKGWREYMVTSWPAFLNHYYLKDENVRENICKGQLEHCFYENIWCDEPCRFYLDIDFKLPKECRRETIEKLNVKVRAFCVLCIRLLRDGRHLSDQSVDKRILNTTDIFMLDSGRDDKFSIHIIFHIDDDRTKFENNRSLGIMLTYLKAITELSSDNEILKAANVSSETLEMLRETCWHEGEFIADMSVYSGLSREFRLWYSSKKNQRRPLLLIDHVRVNVNDDDNTITLTSKNVTDIPFKDQFLNTLACYCKPKDHQLGYNVNDNFIKFNDIVSGSGLSLARTPTEGDSRYDRRKHVELIRQALVSNEVTDNAGAENNLGWQAIKNDWDNFSNYEQYEQLVMMVREDLRHHFPFTVHDELPLFQYHNDTEFKTLVFTGDSKYCVREQREHKSNNVYYVVNLTCKTCYQKCHDANCYDNMVKERKERSDAFCNESSKDKSLLPMEAFGNASGRARTEPKQLNVCLWKPINDFLKIETSIDRAYSSFCSLSTPQKVESIAINHDSMNDIMMDMVEEHNRANKKPKTQ